MNIKKTVTSGVAFFLIIINITCTGLSTDNITEGTFLSDSNINIKQSDISYASGGVYNFGLQEIGTESLSVIFTIENQGMEVLQLTGNPIIAKSGKDSSMFNIIQPLEDSLAAGESVTFEIIFYPSIDGGAGNKSAAIEIASNDFSESVYTLFFAGTGEDFSAPQISDKTITLSNINKTSLYISWNGAEDFLTPEENLEYLVYYSETEKLDSVDRVKSNGILHDTYTGSITFPIEINNLIKGTAYYFNILVKDEEGNEAVYTMADQETLPDVEMIADINIDSEDGLPGMSVSYNGLAVYNDKLYFNANDGANGEELWVFDGTIEISNGDTGSTLCSDGDNPCMVADIKSGSEGGSPQYLTIYNDGSSEKLYFKGNDGTYGFELWTYDSTIEVSSGGTGSILCTDGDNPCMVTDISSGSNSSIPSDLSFNNFTVFNYKLYFQAEDGTNGTELWVYDSRVTVQSGGNCSNNDNPCMVADINSNANDSNPSYLTVFNNKLYFSANDGTDGVELWVYDGTDASRLADINDSGDSSPDSLIVFNSKLYFSASDGANGVELWVYDGTAVNDAGADGYTLCSSNTGDNPCMAADINSSGSSNLQYLTVFDGNLYFSANGDGAGGDELWVYDLTEGASIIADINSGDGSNPSYLTSFCDRLFFQAFNGSHGSEVWVYDGLTVNDAGGDGYALCSDGDIPCMITEINSGVGASSPRFFIELNDKLYFTAQDGINGFELWRYNP